MGCPWPRGGADQIEALASTRTTVFSPCARLTIQRLTVPRETLDPTSLSWSAASKQWVGTTVRDSIFNLAVHEAQDGPGWYNAEINVKGKIIFRYTWNLKKMNDGAGDYRVTFSLDATCGTVSVNTLFDATTVIVEKLDEDEIVIAVEPVAGGTGVLVPADNLTYMDVRMPATRAVARATGDPGKSRRPRCRCYARRRRSRSHVGRCRR